MKVLLDTNVVFAAFATSGLCAEVVEEAASRCELISSRVLLSELSRTLRKKIGVGPATSAALREYRDVCNLVKPASLEAPVCRDPDDDHVLAAVTADADFIVTGDEDLLVIGVFRGISIITPRRFLEILAEKR